MFTHFKVRRLISAYLDKETSEKERAFVEEHLKVCPKCRSYHRQLEKLSVVLNRYESQDISSDLEQRIKVKFLGNKYKEVAKMSKKRFLIGAGSGALAILLMFVLVGGLQNYLKRGLQGRMHDVADELGEQYAPGRGQYESTVTLDSRNRDAIAFGGKKIDKGYDGSYAHDNKALSSPKQAPLKTFNAAFAKLPSLSSEATGQSGFYKGRHIPSEHAVADYNDSYLEVKKPIAPPTIDEGGPIIIVEPYLPATGKEDKLIRNATMSLEVKNVQETYDNVVRIAKDKKGYLAGANFNEQRTGKIGAQVVLRVPKDKFEETIDEIRKLGEVKNFDINSMDVSQDYNSLVSELNTTKIVYDKIAEKLKEKKTDINKAINLESQLTPIAKRIENIRNRISQYDNLISMPTITVNLRATSWRLLLQENIKEVKQRLIELVSDLIKGLIELLPAILAAIVIGFFGLAAMVLVVLWVKKVIRKKTS